MRDPHPRVLEAGPQLSILCSLARECPEQIKRSAGSSTGGTFCLTTENNYTDICGRNARATGYFFFTPPKNEASHTFDGIATGNYAKLIDYSPARQRDRPLIYSMCFYTPSIETPNQAGLRPQPRVRSNPTWPTHTQPLGPRVSAVHGNIYFDKRVL